MKTTFLIRGVIGFATLSSLFAQFKLSSNGSIGLGIEPRSDYKLLIKGDMMLTTYPIIPPPLSRYTEFRFKVGNGWPGCEFGTPTRKIAVWSSEVGYNNLYAAHFYTSSDARLKSNIQNITNGIRKVQALNPVSFNRRDTIGGEPYSKLEFGFVAQDLVQVFPNLVDTGKNDLLSIDYMQIIPLLVTAIKEQQMIIDSLRQQNYNQRAISSEQQNCSNLKEEIEKLKNSINEIKSSCCAKTINQDINTGNNNTTYSEIVLENIPNPFDYSTTIKYTVPEIYFNDQCFIKIFNVSGTLIYSFPLIKSEGEIIIFTDNISNGVYFYSIISNDKILKTKQMIISK
jgi:hypothetical protein